MHFTQHMSETWTIGLAILMVCSISVLFHYFYRKYYDASVYAALSTSLIWQVIAYIDLGYFDPLAPIGFVMGALGSFLVALIIGLPFLFYRRRHQKPSQSVSANQA